MRKDVLIMGVITLFVIVAAYFGAGYYRSSVQKEVKPSTPPTANSASLVREDSPTPTGLASNYAKQESRL